LICSEEIQRTSAYSAKYLAHDVKGCFFSGADTRFIAKDVQVVAQPCALSFPSYLNPNFCNESLISMHILNSAERSKIIGGITENAGIIYARNNRAQIASAEIEG